MMRELQEQSIYLSKDIKQYNFAKFTANSVRNNKEDEEKKPKFDLKNLQFETDTYGDTEPIKSNTTDSNFLFNNDDAIIFDIKRKGNNN